MGRLFCILGKSSTGKDSIYNKLVIRKDIDLKRIVPYTTRPIRAGECDGIDYRFCTDEERGLLEKEGKIIEIRSYPTIHGRWDYFTVDDGEIDFDGPDMAMIGTLESYEKLRNYYKNKDLIPIYIEVEDGIRLQRAIDREKNQKEPKYEELCRRFLADSADFSEEKLNSAGINRRFINLDVDKTVEEIADFIKGVN